MTTLAGRGRNGAAGERWGRQRSWALLRAQHRHRLKPTAPAAAAVASARSGKIVPTSGSQTNPIPLNVSLDLVVKLHVSS